MKLQKIAAYTVYANPGTKYYWIRIRLETPKQEVLDIQLGSLPDLMALVDLLRNESHTMFDTETQNIVIGWEPTGENNPVIK